MKHTIPIGTHVSFEGDSFIYVVDSYQDVHLCKLDCDLDHDHYDEPHMTVRKEHWISKPVSQLRYTFGADGIGVVASKELLEEF